EEIDQSLNPTQIILDAREAYKNGDWEGENEMLELTDVATFFEQADGDGHIWKCKQNGHLLSFGLLGFYRRMRHPLAVIGLPCTKEINVPGNNGIKIQVFERIVLIYDPQHVMDNPPGAEDVYALHIKKVDSPAIAELRKLLHI